MLSMYSKPSTESDTDGKLKYLHYIASRFLFGLGLMYVVSDYN